MGKSKSVQNNLVGRRADALVRTARDGAMQMAACEIVAAYMGEDELYVSLLVRDDRHDMQGKVVGMPVSWVERVSLEPPARTGGPAAQA